MRARKGVFSISPSDAKRPCPSADIVRLRGEIRRLETIETQIETDNRATLAKHKQALAMADVRETELAAQLMAAKELQRKTKEQLKASSGVLHGVKRRAGKMPTHQSPAPRDPERDNQGAGSCQDNCT